MCTSPYTLRVGALAYYDSLTGLLPCRVTSIEGASGPASTRQRVTVTLTADRPGFKAGDVLPGAAGYRVVPRGAVYTRNHQSRIRPYNVEVQS